MSNVDNVKIPGHQLPPIIYTVALIQLTSFTLTRDAQKKETSEERLHSQKSIWHLSKAWPIYALVINGILVLGVIDVVYRPLLFDSNPLPFARVGYVSESSARILIREPDLAKLPLYVSYRGKVGGDISWKAGGTCTGLSNETDFTCSMSIKSLKPSTEYSYATSNNHSGSFKTAPTVGRIDSKEGKFTFLTTSCIKARFPYSPLVHPR